MIMVPILAAMQRAETYILQRFSREWGEFVDGVEIGNGDHLKAVPLPRSVSAGPQENQCLIK